MILRKNTQERQLSPDDLSVLTLVSQQRAVSLDHLPRFLALFEAQSGKERSAHRKSTTYNLVERLQHRGYIHQQRFGKSQSAWIWLTHKGGQAVGISSPWKAPARTQLPALHAANALRLLLTEHDPQISWYSQQQLRSSAAPHERHLLPTAEVENERGERIALHVVLRLTRTEEQIISHMLKQLGQEPHREEISYHALWYYATADAARRLRAARATIAERTTQEVARKIGIFSYPLTRRQVIYQGGSDPFVQTYADHSGEITALAWSPNSSLLASASSDGTVHVYPAIGVPR